MPNTITIDSCVLIDKLSNTMFAVSEYITAYSCSICSREHEGWQWYRCAIGKEPFTNTLDTMKLNDILRISGQYLSLPALYRCSGSLSYPVIEVQKLKIIGHRKEQND
jgi:hypothetical protein